MKPTKGQAPSDAQDCTQMNTEAPQADLELGAEQWGVPSNGVIPVPSNGVIP
jgi:hypothetical protein